MEFPALVFTIWLAILVSRSHGNSLIGKYDLIVERHTTIAFTAVLSKSINIRPGDVIKYDKVLTNVGQGYNSATGIFSVPVSGVYSLSVSMMCRSGSSGHLLIMRNHKELATLYSGATGYEQASHTFNMNLRKGDHIWIQNWTGSYLHGKEVYNLFSAVLISAGNF